MTGQFILDHFKNNPYVSSWNNNLNVIMEIFSTTFLYALQEAPTKKLWEYRFCTQNVYIIKFCYLIYMT